MKNILFLFTLCFTLTTSLMAQDVLSNAPYTKQWSAIDSLIQQGLPQSALEEVRKLEDQLGQVDDGDAIARAHRIKATLYQLELQAQLQEQGQWNTLMDLKEITAMADGSIQAVYQSYLASNYFRYWQNNRWQINNRTELADEVPTTDETTWSSQDFVTRVAALYLLSLEDTSLREINLAEFSSLIEKGTHTDGLRPSVYDLLLHRAMDYFQKHEAFLGEPRNEPALDKIAYLQPVAAFVQLELPTKERTSSYQRLLQVLQEALRWSASTRPTSEAHLDLDLIRLSLVYNQLTTNDKHAAYLTALQNLQAKHKNTPREVMVLKSLMDYHEQRGSAYQPEEEGSELERWYYQKAVTLGEEIIERFPKANAARAAQTTLNRLKQPVLQVAMEAVQLPQTPGLVQLSYRNVEKVYLKAIPITVEQYHDPEKNDLHQATVLKRKARLSWDEGLPQSGDFRQHSVETALRGLPRGVYCLAIATNPSFSKEKGAVSLLYFWVSELAVIQESNREGYRLTVVNRNNGTPVAGATIKLWTNPRRNRGESVQRAVYTTNEQGQAKVTGIKRENVRIEVVKNNDQLYPSESSWIYTDRNDRNAKPAPYTEFFTDRGLYRPGQIVYFKTLALQQNKGVPEIVPNAKFKVTLLDVNGQEVTVVDLVSNAFGSAHGQFTLPASGLLGNMYLRSSLGNSSQQSVRVEEYKRPRFEVTLDDLETEPQLGDSVTVMGAAMAYAGPAIADAEVRYTVTRNKRFPWFRRFSRYYPSYNQPQTIATGTTTTGEDGSFELRFLAEPNGPVGEKGFPLYQFSINVEVVDGTGETRVGEKSIQLTQYPFQLGIQIEDQQNRPDEIVLGLSCENLDGQPITKQVAVKVERLVAPATTYLNRYWERPDTHLLTEKAFRGYFPLFAYAKEEESEHWPVGATIWEQKIDLDGTDSLRINGEDWAVGHYQATLLTVTSEGDTLETTQRFQLHDWTQKEFASGDWLMVKQDEMSLQPDQSAELQMGEQGPSLSVYTALQNRDRLYWTHWLSGNDEVKYDVVEEDRGGLAWGGFYVLRNRFYRTDVRWQIPWSNKELNITYETFRSKLYPDAEEEWIIRIDGPDKDRVTAEVLASMYDASLDQIMPFDWSFNGFPNGAPRFDWRAISFSASQQHMQFTNDIPRDYEPYQVYPRLWSTQNNNMRYRRPTNYMARSNMAENEVMMRSSPPPSPSPSFGMSSTGIANGAMLEADAAGAAFKESGAEMEGATVGAPPTKVRTNLSETAFFFPQLQTDEAGRVVLKFRAPESLTRWKVQLFGHTKELAYTLDSKEVVTQKELMILPNAPRFLREGDRIDFTAKVSNLSEKSLSGQAVLELFDPTTNASLGQAYGLTKVEQSFALAPKASQTVNWSLEVPKSSAGALGYRVIARAGSFSDGEEAALPVLTNRILLTEAQPLFVRPNSTKTFTLERLAKADKNVDQHAFRLDITSNPAWEAIKALPYLQEYPYDCTEQIVNRMFANSLASKVVEDYPKIRDVFADWRNDKNALKSPLLQDEALKTALLEETPWVMEAKNESLQRERIALLFDLDRLANELAVAQRKLLDRQSSNGGFSWFPGGPEQWYMTQYVVEQLSHLRQLTGEKMDNQLQNALERAVRYCDQEALRWYKDLNEEERKTYTSRPSPRIAHYLYTRSLNLQIDITAEQQEMYEFCWKIATDNWMGTSLFEQTLVALAAKYSSRDDLAQRIYASLQERSLHSEELGRYWKSGYGYYWYQNDIETHVKITELYALMGADDAALAELKIWLLRNKETNRWETTKATAAAVYALVSTSTNWLGETTPLEVSFPEWAKAAYTDKLVAAQANAEAGTGAYQVRWSEQEVQPEMATVRLRNRSKAPGWGAIYWQYFTNIDQVTRDGDNPLKIERKLYRRVNDGQGEKLEKLMGSPAPGDRITVRLTVRTDRALEFVHLKDLRASGLEPVDQISTYRYQGGLGYYQQTTDTGTHFFLHYLPSGEYVMEYDLRVFHRGDFSAGLSTIQCMYAPKFTSHSEGVRLRVE